MLNDEKEVAEHLMLIDLGRNDIGKVCRPGSVVVSETMAVEKYTHVMHIASNVQGQLNKIESDGFVESDASCRNFERSAKS